MIEYDKGDIVKVLKEGSPHKGRIGVVESGYYGDYKKQSSRFYIIFEIEECCEFSDGGRYLYEDLELVERSSYKGFYVYCKDNIKRWNK